MRLRLNRPWRIVLLLWAVWWFWGWLLPWPRCLVVHQHIARLSAVAVDLIVGGRRIYLDLHYPPDGVVIADPGDDGSHGIPYEDCYYSGTFDVQRERKRHLFLPALFYPLRMVSVVPEALGTVLAEYGTRGKLMVRVEGRPWEKPLLDRAVRCYLGGRDTLLSTYIPRLRVEQRVRGEWLKLTQFDNGVGMFYYLAPADTIRLRLGWTAMRAVYRRDRLVITPVAAAELQGLRMIVRRVRDGYWPSPASFRPCQSFFRTFRADTLVYGERFEVSFPIRPRFQMFELEARVLAAGTLPYYQLLNFAAPTLFIDGYQYDTTLRYWPLVPTPSKLRAGERSERGYPGGYVVPRWAFERMKRLDHLGVDWNGPNAKVYGREIKAWEDSVGRARSEEARRRLREGKRKR